MAQPKARSELSIEVENVKYEKLRIIESRLEAIFAKAVQMENPTLRQELVDMVKPALESMKAYKELNFLSYRGLK